jgi:predicted nucleic acid-binding protein
VTAGLAPGLAVVDASIAAMWVLPEQFSALALTLAEDWARAGVQPIAPCLMPTEVANAIYKRVQRREMTFDQAIEAFDVILGFGVRLEEEPEIHRRALTLAYRLNRPTPYDAHYLALAELRGCAVWTGDERLFNAARGEIPWLNWIGAYAPAEGKQ